MPEGQALKPVRLPRMRPHTAALWILFVGLVVSLAANVRQGRKTDSLLVDLATVRQETQAQIAELRQAQSAFLEQDLLRLDQLTTQLQKVDEDEQQQAVSLTSKIRSDLAKTVEQRHQEMITAISDLRADLRSAATLRAPGVNDLRKPAIDASSVNGAVHFAAVTAVDNSARPPEALVSTETPPKEQATALPAQKKRFWSKLNPFTWNRNKKQETGASDPANSSSGLAQ